MQNSAIKIISRLLLGGILIVLFTVSLIAENTNETPCLIVIPPDGWKQLSCTEGQFSISFPGVPVQTNSIVRTKLGEVVMHRFLATPDCGTEYSIYFSPG
jgi:hypothetical protein